VGYFYRSGSGTSCWRLAGWAGEVLACSDWLYMVRPQDGPLPLLLCLVDQAHVMRAHWLLAWYVQYAHAWCCYKKPFLIIPAPHPYPRFPTHFIPGEVHLVSILCLCPCPTWHSRGYIYTWEMGSLVCLPLAQSAGPSEWVTGQLA